MKREGLLNKVTAIALAGAMVMSAAGCGANEAESSTTATQSKTEKAETTQAEVTQAAEPVVEMEDTTINIRVMNEYRNLDKVLDKYNEMTADDPIMSKIHLNFSYIPGADYKDRLTMSMVAQEDYDLMFCGSWHGLSNFIQQGNLKDLSGYFNNDAYPGLKAAFSENFVDAMTSYIRQEDGTYKIGVYGVNMASYYEDTRGFMIREDLRKKYNCDPVTDQESLYQFVKTVQENEPDMIGMSLYNFFRMDSPYYSAKHDNVYSQDNVNVFGDQTWVYVGLSEDGKTVLNAVVAGDDEAEFAKMPEGYQYDFITEYTQERTRWNDYLSPSRGSTDTVEKAAAAVYAPLSEYEKKVTEDQTANADEKREYSFYVIEDAQRNMEQGAVVCDMVTNNWLVVPETSEKTDAVMTFLDWMFGSQENHDLFEYGIVGEDWEAVGTAGYKATDISEDEKYVMPTYSFTLNPSYVRNSEFVENDAELKKRFEYMYDDASYQLSPLAGFTFDATAVETQVAGVSALSNELQLTVSMYDADEAAAKIQEWHAQAEKVGLEEVRQELIAQVQAFLDAKNAN